jgi:two-component system, NarL family, nitrate/nitrite response regulator NarL
MKIRPNGARVLIGAEEPIVRYGIRKLLETDSGLHIAGEAADCPATLRLTSQLKPDVLVLDFALRQAVTDALIGLSSSEAQARIIMLLATSEKERLSEVFRWGARGVVFKDSATDLLLASIHAVMRDQYWMAQKGVSSLADALRDRGSNCNGNEAATPYRLTPREFEIISAILAGCSNKDVGRRFSIRERTVKHHLTNIYEKLGLSNRLELAIFALNHGLENRQSRQPHFSFRAELQAKYQEA